MFYRLNGKLNDAFTILPEMIDKIMKTGVVPVTNKGVF